MSEIQSRDEQRARDQLRSVAAVNLELLLRDIVRRGLQGDLDALAEFQQQIQYTPPAIREAILTYIQQQRGVS